MYLVPDGSSPASDGAGDPTKCRAGPLSLMVRGAVLRSSPPVCVAAAAGAAPPSGRPGCSQ
eukprot:11032469-Lingulodinium_polyedra.AAC.1